MAAPVRLRLTAVTHPGRKSRCAGAHNPIDSGGSTR
jgi:hypothetical protein